MLIYYCKNTIFEELFPAIRSIFFGDFENPQPPKKDAAAIWAKLIC